MQRSLTILLLLVVLLAVGPVRSLRAVPTDTLPKITVTPIALNFGRVAVGVQKQLSVLIENTSDSALVLRDSVGQLDAPFTVDTGYGVTKIDSGASSRVYITFKALQSGLFTDTLVITSNTDSAHSRLVVYLSAIGFIPDTSARILVTPMIIDYGIVYAGQSKPMTVTLKNVTNTDIQLKGNVLNSHAPFFVTVGLGNFVLDSGLSKELTIQCAPTDTGSYRDSIIINSNADGANARIVVILRVNVHSADELLPKMSLTSTSLDFGTMTLHSTQELQLGMTIKNISDTERTLICNLIFPQPPFSTTGSNGHIELARFESQQLMVHFAPTTAGDYKDSIIIVSNSPNSRIPVYLRASVVESGSVGGTLGAGPSWATVYPNPTSNVLFVQFLSAAGFVAHVSIYDVTGRRVATSMERMTSEGENLAGLNLSDIPAGVYEGRVEGIGMTKSFKVVINR